jgi:hypothetical protein
MQPAPTEINQVVSLSNDATATPGTPPAGSQKPMPYVSPTQIPQVQQK